jgi:hypothetical protein
MTTAVLPVILRPHQPSILERLGAYCDGGYLVDPRDVAASDGLISLGIAIDWSFEKHFVRCKSVPVRAYDGSLSVWYLMARAARDVLFFKSAAAIFSSVRLVVDYLRFFTGPVRHVRSYVGNVQAAYRVTSAPSISLGEAFDEMRATGSSKPFLKIDIEGSEYSLLGELMSLARVTSGLAIEFHDCGSHLTEITAFVQRYPLRLVHIHANTYTAIDDSGCPGALELTFSSSAQASERPPLLPHPLDSSNDGSARQIDIQFV